jgi:hypothetical protein
MTAKRMRLFPRSDITIRCAYRGAALSVPDLDRLLNSCEPGQRRRLQRCLVRPSPVRPAWSVEWRKAAGEALNPQDVVVILHREGVVVELAYAQKGTLIEVLAAQGERVQAGTRLALLERRVKVPAPEPPPNDILRQFVSRQRRDADLIKALQAELAAHRDLVERLHGEIAALLAGRGTDETAIADLKFKRLKHEFSRRFHPDAAPSEDAERERRALVFREFWPIVEEIEHS